MHTIILALDGADPMLMDDWINGGYLPNLAKIRNRGLFGKLKSTFPPLTGPAWPSFHTGVNPGKHGVYGWIEGLDESYKGKTISTGSIGAKTVWKEITEQGGKVGLLSVPMTYPPENLGKNGFIVPGFLTPSGNQKTHPPELIEQLLEEVPEYDFMFRIRPDRPRAWLANLKKAAGYRGKAARFLLKEKLQSQDDSVLAVHFFCTDNVQHFFWDDVTDKEDPRREVFQAVDRQVGRLMEAAPDNTTFIVVSDHGFGPVEKTFNVNTWLAKEGYLKLKSKVSTRLRSILAHLGFTEQNWQPIGELLHPLGKKLHIIDNSVIDYSTNSFLNFLFLSAGNVDWQHTQAYSRSDIGHVRINLKGREKNGAVAKEDYQKVRKEIMEKLRDVEVPDTGQKLAQWVKPKEEIYLGRYFKKAPDILINSLEGKNCHEAVISYGQVMFFNSRVFSKKIHPGHHRRNGIIMAAGPNVKPARIKAHIEDVAPTLLNLYSYSIPEQIDGEVIEEISPGVPEYYKAERFYKKRKENKDDTEQRKALESLGYL